MSAPESGMERFRLEVGHDQGVTPSNIVGAIANEADLSSKYIGRINIFDQFSTVDLPDGMPKETFQMLKKVYVGGNQLKISKHDGHNDRHAAPQRAPKPAPRRSKKKPTKRAHVEGFEFGTAAGATDRN